METRILTPEQTDVAGEILKNGGLVAIPTETVYGLAADAFNPGAVAGIFAAKGRPADNPLIVHIENQDDLFLLCEDVPEEALLLAQRFWPGPLTIILKRKESVPAIASAGLETVAVRFPSHPVARAAIKAAGTPLAAPSANRSGSPSPTSAAHVLKDLGGRIDAVLDGGECEVGLESTVITLAGEHPIVLRPGAVTKEMLTDALGKVWIDDSVLAPAKEGERVSSPGMKYRHYAPSVPLRAVFGNGADTAAYIRKMASSGDGVICFDEYFGSFPGLWEISYGAESDMSSLAKNLFSALRKADASEAKRLFIQCPGQDGIGLALQNRILRAAAFDVVRL